MPLPNCQTVKQLSYASSGGMAACDGIPGGCARTFDAKAFCVRNAPAAMGDGSGEAWLSNLQVVERDLQVSFWKTIQPSLPVMGRYHPRVCLPAFLAHVALPGTEGPCHSEGRNIQDILEKSGRGTRLGALHYMRHLHPFIEFLYFLGAAGTEGTAVERKKSRRDVKSTTKMSSSIQPEEADSTRGLPDGSTSGIGMHGLVLSGVRGGQSHRPRIW